MRVTYTCLYVAYEKLALNPLIARVESGRMRRDRSRMRSVPLAWSMTAMGGMHTRSCAVTHGPASTCVGGLQV
jgi:hypothetical protein